MLKPTKKYLNIIFLHILFILIATSAYPSHISANEKNLFDTITIRIQNKAESEIDLKKIIREIPEYLSKYVDEKGAFDDVNYAAVDRTNWDPIRHIERLHQLTFAYTMKQDGNPYYNNPSILKIIEDGLTFWCKTNPNCSNWWYNQIGEPQLTALILVELRKAENKLSKELEDAVIERIIKKGGDPRKWTGANKTDIALHWLYRACLTEDEQALEVAVSEGFYPIKFAPFDEGIQPDYSYFQHGEQLYIGGYGDALLKGVLLFAEYTQDTKYQIDKQQLEIIRNFVLQTYYKVIRGSYIHMNVIGRGMSRMNITKKDADYTKTLIKIDPQYAKEYETIAKRIDGNIAPNIGIKPNNTTYYIGDYVAHIRPEYSVGVRTVSTRTMRNEYGNGENLKTYFLSDGSMHFAQKGDEYFNIFPVWDWSRIPGVTNPYYDFDSIPMAKIDWRTRGTENLVGGASDSLYSVNTYRLNDRYADINTSAYKSWFFFDDEIVCLGSDITSQSNLPINTTIEQNRLKGDIIASTTNNKQIIVKEGTHNYDNNLKAVLHNNVGYIFPAGGNIFIKNEAQKGDWNKININEPAGEVSEKVFSLWFDHGSKPLNESYAYIIVPNKKNIKELNQYNADDVQICTNNDSIQAVYNKKLNILEIVFLRKATFSFKGLSIKSNNSSAIIIKNIDEKEVIMHIADPTQSKNVLEIEALLPSISVKRKRISIDMTNSGLSAGKTHMIRINKNTAELIEKYVQ